MLLAARHQACLHARQSLLPRTRCRVQTRAVAMSVYAPSQPPIVFKPAGPHTATLIWLHGLGDSGAGWADVADQFALPGLKLVFPTSSQLPVTLNGGMRMNAWFDLTSLSDIDTVEDRAGMQASTAHVRALVEAEVSAGVPHNRIVVAGFSQGGAIALSVGLRTPQPLAGVVALSTWLPLRDDYPGALGEGAKATPVLQCHGTQDQVVRTAYGQQTHEAMKAMGMNTELKLYPMAHSACPQELDAVRAFLQSRL